MPTSLLSTGVQFPDNSVQGVASDYIMRVYTSPATWTKPTGLRAVKVTVVGGGGAGGRGSPGPTNPGAPGGGGGSAIRYLSAPSVPGPISVTVGAGGTSAPGANVRGNTGGTSSFGALLSATGGQGGFGGDGGSDSGAGGTGSSGDLNITGGKSLINFVPIDLAGKFIPGGTTILSTGSDVAPNGVPNPGIAGKAYGGGGTGGGGPFGAGGTGAVGVVIVEEFY